MYGCMYVYVTHTCNIYICSYICMYMFIEILAGKFSSKVTIASFIYSNNCYERWRNMLINSNSICSQVILELLYSV